MRLVLVRHGESRWNVVGRYQGHANIGLSARGRAQANATAELLAHDYPDAVLLIRSDLERVAQTAAPTAAALGLDVCVDPRLREIDVGTWSGRTIEEIAREDPEGYRAWLRRDDDARHGGGETYAELRRRVWECLTERVTNSEATVLVFTHGGPIRVAVASALGLPPGGEAHLGGVRNCSLTVLKWSDGRPRLLAYNLTNQVRPG